MKINLKVESADPFLIEKITDAGALLGEVLNSQEFKNKVLDFSYRNYTGYFWWKKWFTVNGFYQSGMTNEQVYEKIMSGSESRKPEADNEADIHVVVLNKTNSRVIGYTYPMVDTQYLYLNWAKMLTAVELASNMGHEWCHKLGFEHDFKSTRLRPYSVPYGIGNIISDIASKL